jgi:hypothetical protein
MGNPTRYNIQQAQGALQAIGMNSDGCARKLELFQAFKKLLTLQGNFNINGKPGQPGWGQGGQG